MRWFLTLAVPYALLLGLAMPSAYAATAQTTKEVTRGRAIYEAKCSACHSVDENRVGPKHSGVLGRKAGGVLDYEYSDALNNSRIVWTQTTLTQWLTEPEKLIPGQKMGYRLGLAQERMDVVKFLSTLNPKP